jgi:hypothetical protein
MPDGDIVHNRLAHLYQKSYKSLCEGKASISECAWALVKALKQDLMRKGNLPVILAQRMGERLTRILGETGENGSVDWATLNKEFERIAQQTDGRHDLKELTLRAGKSVLHDLRYGREVDSQKASEAILRQYMNEVYESGFKERIPLTSEHYAGADAATLTKRIEEMQPDISAVTSTWAKKASADGSVANLRLPPRSQVIQVIEVDLDEDLCVAS